jgi:esterase
MTTQPKSVFATVNGLQLHYLDWGNVGAPPVVCVHGSTSSAQAFNAPARHFQDRVHDLAALVDHLGLARFTLIGTSMGGIIAMAYAEAHADRLSRLVINDIGPDVEKGTSRITQMVGSRPDDFATLDDAMAYRREVSPITANRGLDDQRELALGVLKQRPDGRWIWKMDPAYMVDVLPRGELVAVPGVGHAPTLMEPVVRAALERFLG